MKPMQRHKVTIGFVAGLCIGSANAVDPNEFAVGWPLELNAESEFYDIPLRADVYRNARSLDQMAVLDANGEPMPFYRVVEEPDPTPVELVVLEPVPGPADAEEYAFFFDAGGLLPIRAVELELVNPNTWANASIDFGDSLEGPWNLVASRRLYYRVDFQGDQVRAPVVQIASRGARFWRVRPDRSLGEDGIELQLHYPREHLRFAANGAAPYQLVGGGLSTEAGPDLVLSQVWEQLDEEMAVTVAGLGTMSELGGEAAFIPPREIPWRSALLWGTLLLGALAVGWMALRLGREAFT